ncbi:MAG TPA: hypothetical protein VFP98_06475, partial [Candidatus Polarisedimenticolia bacterium]|nr:hypothetical protein [Candidatus Polarisedimenticolia bacterium]
GGAAAMKGRKLSFIGHVVGPKNRRSAPTDIVTIPVCEPPAAPAGGWARITEEGILLGWSPVQAAGYHVYRKEPRGPRPESPLGPALTPAATTTFLDAAPAPGVEYRYLVRAFGTAPRCESADGAMVGAAWRDLFPPAPPEALAAVEEEGSIRLFWRPGRDRDLRGYRVYRAEGIDGPFRLISSDPLTSTSYTDTQVAAGGVYGYAVTSLDGATPPNESSFSDPVMERMEPPR